MGCEVKKKGYGTQWVLVLGALVAIFIALAMSSKTSPKIPLFGAINRACQCAQDTDKYSGIVEDCCCDYETVNNINMEVLHPSLQELVKTPFFRYFKVKLWCDCPFWPDDGMCCLRDCSVCECPEGEFPELLKNTHRLPLDDLICQEGKPEAAVGRTIDRKAFRGRIMNDNPWTKDDETDNESSLYIYE